jgi:1-hydroxycarotenoid 3,4-desaturase
MTKIAIIGSGIGGLVAALLLSAAGREVVVCEAAATPGGKLREVVVGGAAIDAGPTVFTLRPVFEAIFAQAGLDFSQALTLLPLDCLARHAWDDGARLDLFADMARNVAAIGDFAGAAAARGYAEFAARSQKIFETLDASFMQVPQPGLTGLVRRAGPGLLGISPFASLWGELGKYFKEPKLRQLLRLLALRGTRHAHADCACRAARRVGDRGRHVPAGGGDGAARAGHGRAISLWRAGE